MNTLLYISAISLTTLAYGQEKAPENQKSTEVQENKESDTTRFKMGTSEIIIVNRGDEKKTYKVEEIDTIDAAPKEKNRNNEAHWSGFDFGVGMMMDQYGGTSFNNYPQWRNDAAKSWYFNINLMEKKFKIIKEYVGLTTGIGFSFQSYGLRDNINLVETSDTLVGVPTANNYSKNKLKASYFQVPLLLEFNTHADNEEGFYLSAGVIGGVRMSSKTKQEGEFSGNEFENKNKGTYGLNSFKADATVRMGYQDWGFHATYSMLPLFDTNKTLAVHPLQFGLSFNF